MPWQKREISKQKRRKKTKKKGFSFRKLFFILIIFLFLGLALFASFYVWVSFDLPNPDKLLEREIIQSTRIYDREGKIVLYEVFSDVRRTMIDLTQVSPHLINATLASEDRFFYDHPGFSLRGILRAGFVDITQGRIVQGGSTITQQLVKNAILYPEKTFIRKFKELILAFQIEQKFPKDQILKMYFNEIPFGSNVYGAQAAAQFYFGKNAIELTIDESALLAAMLKAPTYFSPYGQNKEQLIARRNYVLEHMRILNFISEQELIEARETETLEKIRPRKERIMAPHFVMDVREYLMAKYGQRMVEQGGLRIVTTLDLELQKIAEEAIKNNESTLEKFGANNAALVALDAQTGEVLAMVGSRDFFDESIDGYVNVVNALRQPGSSFKPIVYAGLFEKGYTTETILFDVETNFGPDGSGRDYIPKNYDGKERGPVTLRKALAGSLNIPAVKTLYLAGINSVLDLAEKMGYRTFADRGRFGLAIVLGGAEVRLLEHTAAFGVLAREGLVKPTVSILKVEDNEGKTLEEKKDNPAAWQQVLDPESARKVTDILADNQARVFMFGERNYLTLPDRPAAVKTGTTQNWRDAWIIGYTPSLVVGVWAGNTRNEAMKARADGSQVAAPIWHEFMTKALADKPVEKFTSPTPEEIEKPILRGEIPADLIVKIDRASGKLATDLTPPSFVEEKSYTRYHSILHYVQRDDPRGLIPENPEQDPMYQYWEEAIKNWSERQGIEFEKPPTEYDDLHTLANQPTVNIISPISGSSFDPGLVQIEVSAQAPRGIKRVEGYINNHLFDTVYNSPYILNLNTTGLPLGRLDLVIQACDDIDNCQKTLTNINLNQNSAPAVFWLSPQNNAIIYDQNFPLPVSVSLPRIAIKELRFYYQRLGSTEKKLIWLLNNPTSSRINITWLDTPATGPYELIVEAVDEKNNLLQSEKILINIYN